jgi:aminopeptidase
MDKRWRDLAEIIVNQSTAVTAGERVMISMHETHTLPALQAVYEACVKAGAQVQVQFLSDTLDRILMAHGTEEQVAQVPEIEAYGMEWADVYISLRGTHNLYEFAAIDDDRLALYRKVKGMVSSLRWEKTRWIVVTIPDEDFAQQAETDLETAMEMFFNACLRDRSAERERWLSIVDTLNRGREIWLQARGTDLRMSLEGRKWKWSDGSRNLPGGEILTSPVSEAVDGYITFEYPGVFGGRLVHDIRLEWASGELVGAAASKNEEFLHRVLATDPGAKKIGEFAFGTNYDIDRFCKDIFFDEKIGGTVHIALGRAYPELGGTNPSAIHWDIIKDLRQGGKVRLDGKLIYDNGNFVI